MNFGNLDLENLRSKSFSKLEARKKAQVRHLNVLTDEDKELLKAAIASREEWTENSKSFEYVSDEKLVDYYTYRIKASEARYAYFLNIVKEKGLSNYI